MCKVRGSAQVDFLRFKFPFHFTLSQQLFLKLSSYYLYPPDSSTRRYVSFVSGSLVRTRSLMTYSQELPSPYFLNRWFSSLFPANSSNFDTFQCICTNGCSASSPSRQLSLSDNISVSASRRPTLSLADFLFQQCFVFRNCDMDTCVSRYVQLYRFLEVFRNWIFRVQLASGQGS